MAFHTNMTYTKQAKSTDTPPWSAATAYVVDDMALLDFTVYICIQAHTNQKPPEASYWTVVTQKTAKPTTTFTKVAKT